MKHSSSRIRGFSLIELMVVVFIIGIVAAFAVPASSTILRGSQLTQASQILTDQLNLARQYALSKNRPVEVRLICYPDPEVPGEAAGSTGNFRAIQVLEWMDTSVSASARAPLDKPQMLPQSIVMNTGGMSTLINYAKDGRLPNAFVLHADTNDPALPRNIGTNYGYMYFRFMPDGSTNLPMKRAEGDGLWYVTLQNMNDPVSANAPPANKPFNFFTLQIDPISGAMKPFRPGI